MDKNKIREHILTEMVLTAIIIFVLRSIGELIIDTGETWKSIVAFSLLFGIGYPPIRRYLVKKNNLEDNYKQKE
ncbi:MAG: hypothetical protein II934_04675 [Prevotella sp.]|nr:hypothetical protein [Prevotella sp.]